MIGGSKKRRQHVTFTQIIEKLFVLDGVMMNKSKLKWSTEAYIPDLQVEESVCIENGIELSNLNREIAGSNSSMSSVDCSKFSVLSPEVNPSVTSLLPKSFDGFLTFVKLSWTFM